VLRVPVLRPICVQVGLVIAAEPTYESVRSIDIGLDRLWCHVSVLQLTFVPFKFGEQLIHRPCLSAQG
jgi:hypothetical protein